MHGVSTRAISQRKKEREAQSVKTNTREAQRRFHAPPSDILHLTDFLTFRSAEWKCPYLVDQSEGNERGSISIRWTWADDGNSLGSETKSCDDLPDTKNAAENDKKMHVSVYDHDHQQLSTLCGASQRHFYATHLIALDRARRELSIDTRTSWKTFKGISH